ncbi:Zn-dependent hydrolase [Solibacillus sp. FSL H8-0538]|uniref:Zn-dependent hydrolase n=1 Tax=Solibacillus sp. FSL H8-0538 TaxID=2921400 RepID=UPI0030FB0FF2
MKQITLNSKEFNQVLKNLQLENMSLTPSLQLKALEIVNSRVEITSDLIKDALNNVKI